jgi:hypothetical protein
MKVADIRRKLMAALAAGGLLAPTAAYAANLNTNLIANGGFENVDLGTVGNYFGPLLLNWDGMGFALSHDYSGGVPNYADGGPLAGGGSWYFYPGSTAEGGTPHHSLSTAITQTVDVSGGDSGTLIASGAASYALSGFFSGFQTQTDHGIVQVDFLSGASAVLGTATLTPGPQDLETWTQFSTAGALPVGTATVKVSAWGALLAGGLADGYMDNLDFQVTNVLPALSLNVNRSTGAITLTNQTGAAENISSYSIASAFEALAPTSWLSIADNYDSGNPGPNQVDAAHAWAEQTAAVGQVSESDPSTSGASLANGRNVSLGSLWVQSPAQDLAFSYVSDGQTVQGIVNYVGGPGGQALVEGDLNVDGIINSADWVILRSNQLGALSALGLAEAYRRGDLNGDRLNDHADFVEFKALFDAANGVGSFAAMVAGVPEPSSCVVALAAGVVLLPARRRAGSRS